ncbi:MAG: 4-hydroxy-tetrahydrodipicolinate synthase [Phycisphaerales bacterium]|nr:4-hydroxy-tetrahydrodipicolinate synthase [Phycisphaerales bacterium]
MFMGVYTALITPFNKGRFDRVAYERQIAFQVKSGVSGIVPVGTTGESPTLSHDEHHKVIETAIAVARGTGLQVIAGTGSNSTDEAIDLTRHAKKAGADAVLLVNPYYNKPTQEGLFLHFKSIADAVHIPIVLYNIPGRTSVTMATSTMLRLAKACKNIVAVKDAAGNLDLTTEAAATGLTVLSGDDSLTLPMMAVGARGVVSVVSNIVPAIVKQLVDAAAAGDYNIARHVHHMLYPLIKVMFVETNPIPVKTAMGFLGRDTAEMRLPLCPPSAENAKLIRRALVAAGLLKK